MASTGGGVGQVWQTEDRLVAALEGVVSVRRTARPRQCRVWREFDTGFGYADLLAATYDPALIAGRPPLRAGAASFTLTSGYAMAVLSDHGATTRGTLGRYLRLNQRQVEQLVDGLVGRGLVHSRQDLVRPVPLAKVWAVCSIEAYEAKLTNWQVAAEQACRHVWFASHCTVVLPRLSAAVLARATDLCRRWRLGLWVFDEAARPTAPTARSPAVPVTQLGWWLNEQLFEEATRGPG